MIGFGGLLDFHGNGLETLGAVEIGLGRVHGKERAKVRMDGDKGLNDIRKGVYLTLCS